MAWPKGKKRDPNQKHGGGWAARKAKEQAGAKEPVQAKVQTQATAKAQPQTPSVDSAEPIQEATVIETTVTPQEPSIASTPTETHSDFVAGGIIPAEQQDQDFLKAMNLPKEDPDKYKHNEEYNTFAGNVKPRGEHANIKTDPSIQEVPEYTPPSTPPPPKEPAKPILAPNPAINDMSAADKEKAAAALVDVILNVWTFIKMGAGSKAGIDIDKVKDLAAQAKIDLNAQIPIGPNEYVSLAQMIESFNAQAPSAFVVSEDFKNKVREPMIREFVKRGIGLTDLQLIIVYWGIEIVTTGWNFWDLKKQGNKIINNQMELLKLARETQSKNTARPVAPAAAAEPTPEKKTEPATTQPSKEFKEPEEGSNKDL